MVTKYQTIDIIEINKLGKKINSKFEEIFKIEKLPNNEQILVYKDNNDVLGFLHYFDGMDNVEILNLIVHEKHRRKKIASILLDNLLSEINKNIILEVRESNIEATSFYTKFNFFPINVRKNYYGTENAIVLERSIS